MALQAIQLLNLQSQAHTLSMNATPSSTASDTGRPLVQGATAVENIQPTPPNTLGNNTPGTHLRQSTLDSHVSQTRNLLLNFQVPEYKLPLT